MNFLPITLENAADLSQIVQARCGWITQVAWSPNGKALAVGGAASVWLFSVDNLTLRSSLQGHSGPVKGVAVNHDGTQVASASADTTVRLWNLAKGGDSTVLLGHDNAVNGVAFDASGTLLVSCSADATVRLWNAPKAEVRHIFEGHSDEVTCIVVTPDLRIISGSRDTSLRLWNTGKADGILGRHDDWLRDVTVSLDGMLLASASKDGTVALWSLDMLKQILRLSAHTGGVDSVSFSPDAQLLATGGRDNAIRLWALETGEQVAELHGHEKPVLSVAFSPDGKRLVSGSGDNTLRLWAVP
jgi:WD40 repeat protein